MRILSFVLLTLVGTMILGFPLQSYADTQLDTLLGIATHARDNLGITISQTNNVSDEINRLYKQGSDETDQLAKAVDQQDVQSAKQHFLAAMRFFKETNDKINSLNATGSNDQQKAEITQLTSEITRLGSMRTLLMNIATRNSIDVNFTKFDALLQTAQQDLNAGNIEGATAAIKGANDFLDETHHSLTIAAQEKISERAKDFTEKQIERFSKMSQLNQSQNTIPPITPPSNPSTVSANTTGINARNSTTAPSITHPLTTPANTVQNYSNTTEEQNPQEMLAELKKLVSEGKVEDALKVIKMLESYQSEKLGTSEHVGQLSSSSGTPNATGNMTNNTSTTTPPTTPPNAPPPAPPTPVSPTTPPKAPPAATPTPNPSTITNGDHGNHNKQKHNDGENQRNNNQDSYFRFD